MVKYCEIPAVFLEMDEAGLADPFAEAKRLAEHEAEKRTGAAMLISWKDARTGESSPNVVACQECYLDGWEMYASSRGADLRVEVNDGAYVFIFKTL